MQVFEGPTESSRQCLIAVYDVEEPVREYAFQVLVVLVAAGAVVWSMSVMALTMVGALAF